MKRAAIGATVLVVFVFAAMIAAFTVGIWTRDDRWTATGVLLLFCCIPTAATAAFLVEDL